MSDSYAGLWLGKFPEDLRTYEHLLWECRPSVVIELGTGEGGSALWFRDRLLTLERYGRISRPLVVSVDVEVERARQEVAKVDPGFEGTIAFVQGDIADPSVAEKVSDLLPADPSCFVVEDTAHTYDTTMAALVNFSRFVGVGGMFVVEDGCVDVEELRFAPDLPRGVTPAIRDWLGSAEGSEFRQRPDLPLYGVSCHAEGWLQHVSVRSRSRR